MNQFLQPVADKINQVMWGFIFNGIILVILAGLITASTFMLQFMVAIVILVVAFSFFYAARKLHAVVKLLKK